MCCPSLSIGQRPDQSKYGIQPRGRELAGAGQLSLDVSGDSLPRCRSIPRHDGQEIILEAIRCALGVGDEGLEAVGR